MLVVCSIIFLPSDGVDAFHAGKRDGEWIATTYLLLCFACVDKTDRRRKKEKKKTCEIRELKIDFVAATFRLGAIDRQWKKVEKCGGIAVAAYLRARPQERGGIEKRNWPGINAGVIFRFQWSGCRNLIFLSKSCC